MTTDLADAIPSGYSESRYFLVLKRPWSSRLANRFLPCMRVAQSERHRPSTAFCTGFEETANRSVASRFTSSGRASNRRVGIDGWRSRTKPVQKTGH